MTFCLFAALGVELLFHSGAGLRDFFTSLKNGDVPTVAIFLFQLMIAALTAKVLTQKFPVEK